MQRHTKIYLDTFGYAPGEFISCEFCGKPAVDIHHINRRGYLGNNKGQADYIENLIAVCRDCHNKCHDNMYTKQEQLDQHAQILEQHGIKIDFNKLKIV